MYKSEKACYRLLTVMKAFVKEVFLLSQKKAALQSSRNSVDVLLNINAV